MRGLELKALQETGGYHFDQVLYPVSFCRAGSGGCCRQCGLTLSKRVRVATYTSQPMIGFDACGFGCIIKGNAAVHNAVVSNGNGGLAQLFDIVKQAVNTAGAIQQAVLSMQVQVGELSLRLMWRGFWHNVSLCCCGKCGKAAAVTQRLCVVYCGDGAMSCPAGSGSLRFPALPAVLMQRRSGERQLPGSA